MVNERVRAKLVRKAKSYNTDYGSRGVLVEVGGTERWLNIKAPEDEVTAILSGVKMGVDYELEIDGNEIKFIHQEEGSSAEKITPQKSQNSEKEIEVMRSCLSDAKELLSSIEDYGNPSMEDIRAVAITMFIQRCKK